MTDHVADDDLALYAAGILDDADRAAVARHLDGCAACRASLERAERVAWSLAAAAVRPAPASLRERIVARHRRRGIVERLGLPTPLPAALGFAVIALIVLPLSLVAAQSRAELERERALRDEYARVLTAVAAGGQVFAMRPSAGVSGRGTLVIARDAQAYLVLELPEPPAGKAYEAWVIRGGEPVRAGMAPARSGVVIVRLDHPLRPGDIAAVTLEIAAGVDRPTSDPLLVGGPS